MLPNALKVPSEWETRSGRGSLPETYRQNVTALWILLSQIEDGGSFVVTGCTSGHGLLGQDLTEALAELADYPKGIRKEGVNIYCSTDRCSRNTNQGIIQIWRGENTGVIHREDLKGGFRRGYKDEDGNYTSELLRDTENGIDGNIILDPRSGQVPIKIK